MYKVRCQSRCSSIEIPIHAFIYAPCGTGKSWAQEEARRRGDQTMRLYDTDTLFDFGSETGSRIYSMQPEDSLTPQDWLNIFGVGFCKRLRPETFNVILTNLETVRDKFRDECCITLAAPSSVTEADEWLSERTKGGEYVPTLREIQRRVREEKNTVILHHTMIYELLKVLQYRLHDKGIDSWSYYMDGDEIVVFRK